jgi:HupE / UreJ protein
MRLSRLWSWMLVLGVLSFCIPTQQAVAHSQSYGYLTVASTETGLEGQLELAVRDLDRMLALDSNGDGKITWGDVRTQEKFITENVLATILLSRASDICRLQSEPTLVDQRGGEPYLVVPFVAACGQGMDATVTYTAMFAIDAQHRGLVVMDTGTTRKTFIMSPQQTSVTFSLRDAGAGTGFLSFVQHGMHHLWTGYDHLLFLVTLLLATVWNTGARGLRAGIFEASKVVTAFTLSHSLTLGLAATGVVSIPESITESLIALTIALAALNNIWPLVKERVWLLALIFGLVHGLGFANVLADLDLPKSGLLLSLFAFNLGVELAQLVIVVIALPVFFVIAKGPFSRAALPMTNAFIVCLGAAWFSDRAFGTSMMPF